MREDYWFFYDRSPCENEGQTQRYLEASKLENQNMRNAVSFSCPDCQRVSYHPRDLAEGYCGNCHRTTDPQRHQYQEYKMLEEVTSPRFVQ